MLQFILLGIAAVAAACSGNATEEEDAGGTDAPGNDGDSSVSPDTSRGDYEVISEDTYDSYDSYDSSDIKTQDELDTAGPEDETGGPDTLDTFTDQDVKDALEETLDTAGDVGEDLAEIADTLKDTLQDTFSDTIQDLDSFSDSFDSTDVADILCVPEKCDDLDNDCDGFVDEDFTGLGQVCAIGEGICYSTGYYVCSDDGESAFCNAPVVEPQDESCDGLDNNCNGSVDEGCACNIASYQPVDTECGDGACYSTGATYCDNGEVKDSCEPGQPLGLDNTCDNIDDDCDGLIDEHYIQAETTCGTGGCLSAGIIACIGGNEIDSCVPGTPALNDATCNNKDDDCDGSKDEHYVATQTNCGVGACVAQGLLNCVNGAMVDTCAPKQPTPEVCDGINNDCDETVDEGCACVPATYTPTPTTCGTGECASTGATYCDGGAIKDSCAPKMPSLTDATCNNKDDDCDGSKDEHYVAMQTNCGVGACVAQGLLTCVNGGTIDTCAPKQPAPTDASCNNIDDDCNGAKDEDYVPTQTNCGVGACVAQGLLTCVNGATVDTCAPKQPAPSELCDSIDNNCNGAVDEGLADNDLDGVCNELDCEVNEPLDKYLVLNCYTDPSLTAKMSVEACWNDLTNAATLPGELAYIGLDYFDTGISFTGNGIKLCVHPLWTDCTDEPLPLACDHEISFETKLLGTQYIWNLVSPNPDDYQAEFHFDQTKNPDVASVQIFLYMNNSSCNYLYNAFSCN